MGQKTDVTVKLVLVFFVSLLSFSIGTYVGRKYSDNQHQMAQLEPDKKEAHKSENREVASEHGNTEANKTMSDEEIAKLAEEFVADDKAESAHAPANHGSTGHGETKGEAPTAHGESGHGEKAAAEKVATTEGHGKTETAESTHGEKNKETPTHKSEAKTETKHESKAAAKADPHAAPLSAAQALVSGKVPAEKVDMKDIKAEHARVPSSIPKDVAQYSVGKYTVQIASYITKDEAEKKSTELQSKGFNAFIVPAQVKGKSYFRVSVGLFATEKEAKDYKADFLVKSKIETAIIQKISQ